jgi:hypothetical protein
MRDASGIALYKCTGLHSFEQAWLFDSTGKSGDVARISGSSRLEMRIVPPELPEHGSSIANWCDMPK